LKILITGSTGKLGSALIKQMKGSGHDIKLTSRRKPDNAEEFNWVYSNLLSGEGLEEAIKDIEVIIHAATSPMKNTKDIEVLAFKKFLKKLDHVKHFIYPSIVGIENIPFSYYKHKYKAEELLKMSNVPHTIVRATQFHSFVENLLLSKTLFKRYFIPGEIKFQSVDVDEFANYLINLIDKMPEKKTIEFGGPEILTLKRMAEQKIKINNESNKVITFSFPGKLYTSLVEGKNTNPEKAIGKITFKQYLENK